MEKYTDIETQVEYGLDKIDPDRTIEVNLRDFLYLHNMLDEFVRFFHQPMHYKTIEDVNNFLGNKERGGFHILGECIYKKFQYRDIFPEDIVKMIEDAEFEHPDPPYYYQS